MQILKLLQLLLHFCMFYIGLVLVLPSKRCLPLIPDVTKMLLSFIANSYFRSGDSLALPVRNLYTGGGTKTSQSIKLFTCNTTNYLSILSTLFVNMPSLAYRIHHTLSANGSCPFGAASGSSQTAAAGFLYIFGLKEFTEERNEYHKKEELRRSG